MQKRFSQYLCEPIDGASVAFIRVSFAAVMVYWLAMHLVLDKIAYNYYEPSFLFPYTGFEWIQPWQGRGLHVHFLVVMVAALGMLFGVFYRFCSVIFALGFAYIFLLDKATYQNHYYFICLLAILFVVCPAERALSFDAIRKKLSHKIPRWVVLLFQFQIGVTYFFGGVAKINADWLSGFPMRQVLAEKHEHLLIGSFCGEEWFVMFFVWSGMLFDLFIVPMLLWKRTRILGYCFALTFHLLNASLFRIGIFPWAMIFLTTIYFAPDWPRKLLGWAFGPAPDVTETELEPEKTSVISWFQYRFICLFVALQILVPLRHFAFSENTSWTERHHHFAWHMKLRAKNSVVRFYAFDPKSGKHELFPLQNHLKIHQLMRMSRDPWMIRDFANFIKQRYSENGFDNIQVRVFSLSSLNGRKPQLLVNPKIDLTQNEMPDDWIMPLKEAIGGNFDEPLTKWERIVMRDPYFRNYTINNKTTNPNQKQVNK